MSTASFDDFHCHVKLYVGVHWNVYTIYRMYFSSYCIIILMIIIAIMIICSSSSGGCSTSSLI